MVVQMVDHLVHYLAVQKVVPKVGLMAGHWVVKMAVH